MFPLADRPDKASISVNDTTPEHEQTVKFECRASGGRPEILEYIWYKQNAEANRSPSSQWLKGPLDYSSDDGEYSCAARNTVGNGLMSDAETITVTCKCTEDILLVKYLC